MKHHGFGPATRVTSNGTNCLRHIEALIDPGARITWAAMPGLGFAEYSSMIWARLMKMVSQSTLEL